MISIKTITNWLLLTSGMFFYKSAADQLKFQYNEGSPFDNLVSNQEDPKDPHIAMLLSPFNYEAFDKLNIFAQQRDSFSHTKQDASTKDNLVSKMLPTSATFEFHNGREIPLKNLVLSKQKDWYKRSGSTFAKDLTFCAHGKLPEACEAADNKLSHSRDSFFNEPSIHSPFAEKVESYDRVNGHKENIRTLKRLLKKRSDQLKQEQQEPTTKGYSTARASL